MYIFDFDGTIINNEDAHLQAWVEALKIFHREANPSLIQQYFGRNAVEIASQFIQDKKQAEECAKIKEQIYDKLWRRMSSPVPCVEELIAKLKNSGKSIAIASSSTYEMIVEVLQYFDLLHLFDVIVGIDNVHNPKPHPELLLSILNKLDIPPSQAIYIGDSPIDVLTACNAGVHSIYLNIYERGRIQEKLNCSPDLAIRSLCELLNFLKDI